MRCWWFALAACWTAGAAGSEQAAGWPSTAVYSVQSALSVNEWSRRERDVASELRARLRVEPGWRDSEDPTHVLLIFTLESCEVWARGVAQYAEPAARDGAALRAWRGARWAAEWRGGAPAALWLAGGGAPPALGNYQRALTSLFLRGAPGEERNETDVSGDCLVAYEGGAGALRRVKRRCRWRGAESGDGGGALWARRLVQLQLGADGEVRGVQADELLGAGGAHTGGLGVALRSWHRLQLEEESPAAAAAAPAGLRERVPPGLREAPLELQPTPDDEAEWEEESLSAALAATRAALGGEAAGGGGAGAGADAALRLLPALRAAPAADLRAQLELPDNQDILVPLCRLAGAAGGAALGAVRGALRLEGAEAPRAHALAFFEGFAHSDAEDSAILEVLALARDSKSAVVRDAALRAAAGAAGARAGAGAGAAGAVREHALKVLQRCGGEEGEEERDECVARAAAALGALRCASCADALLRAAEGGAGGGAGGRLAALRALRALPPRALGRAALARLERLALEEGAALEVRAGALEAWLGAAAAQAAAAGTVRLPGALEAVAGALRGAPHELRRLLWAHTEDLARDHAAAAAHAAAVRADHPHLYNYYYPGTSSVLERVAATGAGSGVLEGWELVLRSTQAAAGGVLRAGDVALLAARGGRGARGARGGRGAQRELAAVELRTAGLQALAPGGGEEGAGGEAEEAAAWLGRRAGGVAAAAARLFAGQAGLAAAVWAGAGSEPTPVLRAVLPLQLALRLPSAAGAEARLQLLAAADLALDARAQVSLWSRAGAAGAVLRGAGAGRAAAGARAGWGRAAGAARGRAAGALRITAHLDFYDGVALCVRARVDPVHFSRNVTLSGATGALRTRRSDARQLARAPHTLSLGADNDRACRRMHSPADHEDD